MQLNNFLKIVAGICGTIILGAVGSGVWERVLAPAISYLSSKITGTLSSISQHYSDSLYKSAANIYNVSDPRDIIVLVFMLVCMGLIVSAITTKTENRYIAHAYRLITIISRGWSGIFYWSAVLTTYIFILAHNKTIEGIEIYAKTQMEIVRPYIGEVKYIRMRSDFLRVTNKADFDNFLSELYTSAAQTRAPVQKFTPP